MRNAGGQGAGRRFNSAQEEEEMMYFPQADAETETFAVHGGSTGFGRKQFSVNERESTQTESRKAGGQGGRFNSAQEEEEMMYFAQPDDENETFAVHGGSTGVGRKQFSVNERESTQTESSYYSDGSRFSSNYGDRFSQGQGGRFNSAHAEEEMMYFAQPDDENETFAVHGGSEDQFPSHGYEKRTSNYGTVGGIVVEVDSSRSVSTDHVIEEDDIEVDVADLNNRECSEKKARNDKAKEEQVISDPRKTVNMILRQCEAMDSAGRELYDLGNVCYNDLQSSISSLKQYYDMIGSEETNSHKLLSNARLIVSRCMGRKIERCSKISNLTAKLQHLSKALNRGFNIVIDPKHQLPNLDKCFQTVLNLYEKINRKVKENEKMSTVLYDYQREFKNKLSLVLCWIQRWTSSCADIGANKYNIPALTMRHKLLETFDVEAKHIKSELEQAELLYLSLNDEPTVSQEDKCANEDSYTDMVAEFILLVEETETAKKVLKHLETEARDLDSLFVEEATLMKHIEAELREFYEFFTSRPALTTSRGVARMSKHANSAIEKLVEVAHEMDAVYSIQELKKSLNEVHPLPLNLYTTHTIKHMCDHFNNTQQSARAMENWLHLQKKAMAQLDAQCTIKYEREFNRQVMELGDLLRELLNDGSKIVEESAVTIEKKKVERVLSRLTSKRDNTTDMLYELVAPLHARGVTTSRLIALTECWDHCVFTLQILLDDRDQQIHLLRAGHHSMGERYDKKTLINRSHEYYSNLGGRLLCPQSNVKVSEDNEVVIGGSENEAMYDFKSDIPAELLQFSKRVDPYGRVTCTAWLDMIYKTSKLHFSSATLKLKQRDLEDNFSLLCDGKPYITEETLKNILRNSELLTFCEKNLVEHFGWESEELVRDGIKCYDYRRFICKLLGLHRKLSVSPDY